jgi:hypothetical protein
MVILVNMQISDEIDGLFSVGYPSVQNQSRNVYIGVSDPKLAEMELWKVRELLQ